MADRLESDILFDDYWRYSATLRNWLIAYGAGGLVFVTQHQLLADENRQTLAMWTAGCFLAGVALQVFLVFANKLISYGTYKKTKRNEDSQHDPGEHVKPSRSQIIADKISSCFWIDVVIDILTMLAFASASILLVTLLAGVAGN